MIEMTEKRENTKPLKPMEEPTLEELEAEGQMRLFEEKGKQEPAKMPAERQRGENHAENV